jgi:hypothetical protein
MVHRHHCRYGAIEQLVDIFILLCQKRRWNQEYSKQSTRPQMDLLSPQMLFFLRAHAPVKWLF